MLELFSLDDPVEAGHWDDYVESHPNGTPYHLSCWLRTMRDTYAFDSLLYVWKTGVGKLSGGCPFFKIKNLFKGYRLVSLPFSDYGGPLFYDDVQESQLMRKVINEHAKSTNYIEIRGPLLANSEFVSHNHYKRHVMNLDSDLSAVRRKINKRTIQYSIRKAEKSGIKIEEANSSYGIDQFYRLNALTRKKHGVPGQPRNFFENLFKEVITKGHGFLMAAIYQSKTVASSLFLKCGNTLHYKYNASDPDVLGTLTPNHSLTWEAIVKGCREGYKLVDFGRTSPDNKGLIRYKEMWGAKASELPYFYYPQVKGVSSAEETDLVYRILSGAWRSLPDGVVERIGPMLYKRMA
jgi:CelD/BcsL family acetyltransferase involved in cellulose biosynthesis